MVVVFMAHREQLVNSFMKKLFFIAFPFFLFACSNGKKEKPLSPKPIPSIYIDVNTTGLQKIQDIVYFNDKKFDGYVYEMFNPKDTAFVKSYLNGLEEGLHKSWYPNTQLFEERFYRKGKKEGTHRAWWENGTKQYEYQISNDEYTAEFKEWNREGQLIKFFHYKNGHEDGSQKLFYDNGSIRSNYVIIKGRRFGLLGTKNCKNVKDSLSH
jgi:antitoxin component YwqK of YwqJK toxin-antitoxin module